MDGTACDCVKTRIKTCNTTHWSKSSALHLKLCFIGNSRIELDVVIRIIQTNFANLKQILFLTPSNANPCLTTGEIGLDKDEQEVSLALRNGWRDMDVVSLNKKTVITEYWCQTQTWIGINLLRFNANYWFLRLEEYSNINVYVQKISSSNFH